MRVDFLCHLVDRTTWESCADSRFYTPASLSTEGFVHLSTLAQAAATANRFYHGRGDLLLLVVLVERLTSPLQWEDLYGHGEFPHLYGPLDRAAIVVVEPIPCHNDGTFTVPDDVKVAYAC